MSTIETVDALQQTVRVSPNHTETLRNQCKPSSYSGATCFEGLVCQHGSHRKAPEELLPFATLLAAVANAAGTG